MVGRAVERDALSAAHARARTGQSQIFLITGPAGIGKTRLVEELCAGATDGQVLIGKSAPLAGAALAYGPFVDALRDHAGWLLDEDQDHSDDVLTQRHRLFVRVLGALTDLAARAPVLLAVWALGGFYASLGPSLIDHLVGSASVIDAGLGLAILTGVGALSTYVLRTTPARTVSAS